MSIVTHVLYIRSDVETLHNEAVEYTNKKGVTSRLFELVGKNVLLKCIGT